MGILFGTDGIRGVANTYPITCELALKAGQAIGRFVREQGYGTVVIGKDTRISGDMLESALAAGVASTGANVSLAGVIPTPGVAYWCQALEDAGAGIVISASHNPFQDNGIKIFKQGGIKLSDEQEGKIEDFILNQKNVPQKNIGKISIIPDSLEKYAQFLLAMFPFGKHARHLRIVVDCSNGAASKIGHRVFENFDACFINDAPDGRNINDGCGSQHTQELQQQVVQRKADIGLAFDGDADRLIAVDENGRPITGDRILAICARLASDRGDLDNRVVVSTIMSNIGLSQSLEQMGICHVKADVGDRKVLEEMKRCGAVMGGEDSGHMIFLNHHTTGDGMLSALKLLEVMVETGQPLSSLGAIMRVYPQVLMNVDVSASRPDFMQKPLIVDTIKRVENLLGSRGRVLVRYSGTQPLVRVMVEGPDQTATEKYCREICDSIKKHL